MKFFYSLILFALLPLTVLAQSEIKGTVVDLRDNLPVKDAAVRLFAEGDSTLLTGTATESDGNFTLKDIREGVYRIEINYMGFSTYTRKNIQVKGEGTVILDTIQLGVSTFRTDEIEVKDEKPLMEFSDDKKVFNVSQTMTAKGETALDLLRKIPLLDVDANDNITLRGSRNARILIDDKPMKFSSLRQLPAEAIKKVEIITNPSAKYEAEGITGIINIVLKEEEIQDFGYNGYMFTGYNSNKRLFGNIGINMKKNKWSIFSGGGGGYFNFRSASDSRTNYFSPVSSFTTTGNRDGISKYYFGNLGIEHQISKGHSLGLESYFNISNFDQNMNSESTDFDSTNTPASYLTNNGGFNGKWNSFSGSLYYLGKLDGKGREISGEVNYSHNANNTDNDQTIQSYDRFYIPVNNTPTVQYDYRDEKSDNLSVQADYVHPLGGEIKLEAGYKGILRINDNDFISDTLNYTLGTMVRNDAVSNRFKLTEQINAVYTTLAVTIDRFRIKAGLRAEHTRTNGEQFTVPSEFTKDYTDIFPTLSVSRKIGLMNEIQASYSRRITRPYIYRLNPFENRYNSRYVFIGNPDLNPEFTDSYELSYMFYSNIATVTPILFLRHSTDVMTNYTYLRDSITTVSTFINSARADAYGLDLIVSSRAFKWLNLNGSASFYESKFEGDITDDIQGEEGFSWRANIRAMLMFDDLFNLEIYYNYNGKRYNANGFSEPQSNLDISLSKSFINKKLTLTLRAEDIFKTRKWGSETNGTGLRTVMTNNFDSRAVTLNLSYRFGNTEEYYSKSKKTKKNENEKQDTKEEGVQ